MLAQTSHITLNNPILSTLSELKHDSFFFPYNQNLSAYLKRKQSYDVLAWSSKKNVFATFADIASKQTDSFFFQKWDL